VNDIWKKVQSEKACELVSADILDAASSELLDAEIRPEAYIRKLSDAKKWVDAVKVMSRTLPPRESVWWACVCARQMDSLGGNEGEIQALKAAETWVYEPTDENRLSAFALVQESQSQSAGMLSAMAAAFSAGNLPVSDDQFVDIDDAAFTQVVDAAVMVSAGDKEGEAIYRQLERFLRCGEDIARGGSGQIAAVEA
jgi:hypothetical protein